MGNNPHIYRLSPALVREASAAPDYLKFAMICMTLSHRMNRIRGDPGSNQKALVEKFYMYRGDAIRSLREHLSLEHHRLSDVAITGIVTLLLTDVR